MMLKTMWKFTKLFVLVVDQEEDTTQSTSESGSGNFEANENEATSPDTADAASSCAKALNEKAKTIENTESPNKFLLNAGSKE